MTEQELVEKVARAIYEAGGFAYDGRTVDARGRPYGQWATAVEQARAALSVIHGEHAVVPREPTADMQEALWLASELEHANDCYRAMIRAGEIK